MAQSIKIESLEWGKLLVKKSRGNITVKDIKDALRDNDYPDHYVLFLKATQFDGWSDEDMKDILDVELFNICLEDCPVCGKRNNDAWEEGYQQGLKEGKYAN